MRHRRTLEDMEPDPPLTADQERVVRALSVTQLGAIDTALLSNVGTQWRKVAMVIGMTLHDLEGTFVNLPDVFSPGEFRV